MARIGMDEFLNSIKAENMANNNTFNKTLEDINVKLDELAEAEIEELIKSDVRDLKDKLESRYQFVNQNFEDIKVAFENLNEKQDLFTKNSDMKIMFNILNENIDNFAKDVNEQKSLINKLEKKLADFRKDTSKKDEIIKNVAVVKDGIDEVNRGLQASIMEVNTNLRNITKSLMTMDVTDQNDIMKRELENIYLSTNAIFSSLEIFDQKNDEIAKNVVTKEDLINLSGKLDNSFALVDEKIKNADYSEKIISEIEKNRLELANFNQSVSAGLSEYLNSVREVLAGCIEDMKQVQADGKVENTKVSGSHMKSFEKIAGEISNITDAIADNREGFEEVLNEKFKDLTLAFTDFKTYIQSAQSDMTATLEVDFEKLEKLLSQSSAVFGTNFDEVSEKLDKNTEALQKLTSENEISFGNALSEVSGIKAEISRILENMTDFNSHQEARISSLGSKAENELTEMKADLNGFCNNFETLKYTLEQSNLDNRELLTEIVNDASEKIRSAVAGLNVEDSQEALKNVDIQLELVKEKITELGTLFASFSSANLDNVMKAVEDVSNKVDVSGVDLSTQIDGNFETIKNFIESSKEEFSNNKSGFEGLSSDISNLKYVVEVNVDAVRDAVREQKESFITYLEEIKALSNKDNDNNEEFNQLIEKLLSLETALHDSSEFYSDNLMMLQNKIADCVNVVESVSKQSDEKLDSSIDEINSIKSELNKLSALFGNIDGGTSEKLEDVAKGLVTKIDEMIVDVCELKDDINRDVTLSLRKNTALVDEKFTELQYLLNDNNLRSFDQMNDTAEEINSKINDLKNELGLINTDITETVNAKLTAISDEITPLKRSIDDFLNVDFDKIIDNVKSQIELSYLNFSADVNENLTENHDNYVHLEEAYSNLSEKFGNIETLINDLTENHLSVLNNSINDFDTNLAGTIEKTNSLLESWKNDMKRLESKMEMSSKENKEIFENKLVSLLKKDDFTSEISGLTLDIASIETDLQTIKTNVDTSAQTLSKDLEEKTCKLSTAAQAENIENLAKALQDKLEVIAKSGKDEKLEEMLQNLHEKIDVFVMSDNDAQFEELEENLNSLHEKVDVIAASETPEEIERLVKALHDKLDVLIMSDNDTRFDGIEDSINGLHDKIDVLTMSDNDARFDDIEDSISVLHDKIDAIATSAEDEKIEEMVQALHEKVDVIATSDDVELYDEIQNIKDLIFEQRRQIEKFEDNEKNLEIDKRLERLLSDISALDFEKNASDIKDSVMNAILTVAEQISFVEETEEIKDFVEERTDEINKNLLEVKKQLSNIACSSEAWDYSYTMQDIESDIAKLRIILNEISSSSSKEEINKISQNMHMIAESVNTLHSSLTEEQVLGLKADIEKINTDVISLSSRTNKILLTSDESYKALSDGLNEFSGVINQLQKRLDVLDERSQTEVLEKKLDSIDEAVTTSANANNIIRQVMMYLGEWIDETTPKLDTIAEDTSGLSIIHSELGLLKSMIGNKDVLDSLEQKFKDQQNRIELLEKKINTILKTLDSKDNTELELKLESVNERVDENLQKLDMRLQKLDERLEKLSNGIEKLASYVDED